jgi:hypothetical protein
MAAASALLAGPSGSLQGFSKFKNRMTLVTVGFMQSQSTSALFFFTPFFHIFNSIQFFD